MGREHRGFSPTPLPHPLERPGKIDIEEGMEKGKSYSISPGPDRPRPRARKGGKGDKISRIDMPPNFFWQLEER